MKRRRQANKNSKLKAIDKAMGSKKGRFGTYENLMKQHVNSHALALTLSALLSIF